MGIERGPSGLTMVGEDYESVEFTLAASQTNYDVKTEQSFFARIKLANHVAIRTDKNVTVRFNSTTKDAITVEAYQHLTFHQLLVSNIFLTNTEAAEIKIIIS